MDSKSIIRESKQFKMEHKENNDNERKEGTSIWKYNTY